MKGKKTITSSTFFNSRVTATISISLVLFLLGVIVLLSLVAKNLSVYVKENITFDVVLDDEMSETQIQRLQKQINTIVFVKSTNYISKEDAAKQLEADLGQDPVEFLGYNPLPALIEVKVHSEYANNDSIASIQKKVKSLSTNIKNIEFRKELVQIVNDNMKKVNFIIFGLAILLLLISFALINNTIRLMIYSKRFLIHTMKLVGATNGFIRKPFIRAHIVSGIIAALVAIGMIWWLIHYASNDITGLMALIDLQTLCIVFGSVIVLGILISVTATYFAVNKYLRMRGDDLYYI